MAISRAERDAQEPATELPDIDWSKYAPADGEPGVGMMGNAFWKRRKSHGVNPKYANAEQLLADVLEYFASLDEDPLYESKVSFYEGEASEHQVAKMRAPTIRGLCVYLGMGSSIWADWRRNRPDLYPVIEWADDYIYQRKFEGASAGLLNANIISRDLGLTDKQEVTGKQTVVIEEGDSEL